MCRSYCGLRDRVAAGLNHPASCIRAAGVPPAFVSSFASHAVVPANAAIPVSPAIDPGLSRLLGCGVMAGLLSVTKRAHVRPGETVAIYGCGGVGLSAVIGRSSFRPAR